MTKLSVLVPSCDAYADVWGPFWALFKRNWPDCPYPVYLGSNHVAAALPGINALLVGEDRSWAESTRRMVEQIETPYLLMMLEDFLLHQRVDTCRISRLFSDLERLHGGYLRLKPFPPPDLRLARYPEIGEIELGAPYRAALQAAIWHKEVLLNLLQDGETAWEMEVYGSRRSDLLNCGFYCVWKPAMVYYAGVTMGRWLPYGVAICREQGVSVDLSKRPMLTPKEVLQRELSRIGPRIFRLFSWKARRRLLLWFRATGLRKPRPIPGRSGVVKEELLACSEQTGKDTDRPDVNFTGSSEATAGSWKGLEEQQG